MAQFQKGQSGNPNGRPPGSRGKATRALEVLFDNEGEALSRRCIELAKDGDMQALKLCLDRVLPPRKDRPISFPLPPITNAVEASPASAALLAAVSSGELTPGEGAEISRLIEGYIKTLEVTEHEERLTAIEATLAGKEAIP